MTTFDFTNTTITIPVNSWTINIPDSKDNDYDREFESAVADLFSEYAVKTFVSKHMRMGSTGDFEDYVFFTKLTLNLRKPSSSDDYEIIEVFNGDTVAFIDFSTIIVTRAVTGLQEIY